MNKKPTSYWVIHENQEILKDTEGKFMIFVSLSSLMLYLAYILPEGDYNYDKIIIDEEDLENGINIMD
tara:strand:- start:3765 stop:3968 length:204 start_codon:yes stop_codon:yes gene_type:complete